jgi:hypothetical protein
MNATDDAAHLFQAELFTLGREQILDASGTGREKML